MALLSIDSRFESQKLLPIMEGCEELDARMTCDEFPFEKGFPLYDSLPPVSSDSYPDLVWDAVREESKLEAEKEPILSTFLHASVLSHDCLEQSLGCLLANRLQNAMLLETELIDIFYQVLMRDADIRHAIRSDAQAFNDRDPSCLSYSSALLYSKGYHALQTYRVAHALWNQGRQFLALAFQSRISEAFGIDIHPGKVLLPLFLNSELQHVDMARVFRCHQIPAAAKIGEGILLSHGTGLVIGETTVIGNRVSLMHGVTLGGTGKQTGDRHPKISDGVLLGSCVAVLGNIRIGEGAMIAAGSVVLNDVPPHSMVAGNPAKIIGYTNCKNSSISVDQEEARTDTAGHLDAAYGSRRLITTGSKPCTALGMMPTPDTGPIAVSSNPL